MGEPVPSDEVPKTNGEHDTVSPESHGHEPTVDPSARRKGIIRAFLTPPLTDNDRHPLARARRTLARLTRKDEQTEPEGQQRQIKEPSKRDETFATPLGEEAREIKNQEIIERNIGRILDEFSWIDPQHQQSEYPRRRGFRGGDMETYDDGLEFYTRIIYKTSTGEITEPPEEFWEEGNSGKFNVGDYSMVDTFLRDEGSERRPYPDDRYLLT